MMRYRPLVTPSSQPQPRPFPSGRYARTDPLRRLFGLQLLAEPLPEPLRPILIWTWMHPGRYNGNQAIPTRERQRLPDNVLLDLPPTRLCGYTQIELEVGRRIVELPRTEITREMRNWLLRAQATYLAALYAALVKQLGEAQAQAEFTRRILALR